MWLSHQEVLSFCKAMPIWIKEKLFQKNLLFNKLKEHDKNYKSDENIFLFRSSP